MASTKRFCAVLAVVAALLVPCVAMADFYTDHLVIGDDFDNRFSGTSLGADVSGGNAYFAQGTNTGKRLKYNQADIDVLGSNGMTLAWDFDGGDSPNNTGAPGWMFAFDTDAGMVGARVQSDKTNLRGASPGGFFGGGNMTGGSKRYALTLRSLGSGNVEAELYMNGSPAGTSGSFAASSVTSDGYVGAASSSFEWRLSDATFDNFMVFNVGMSDAQVAGIPATAPAPIPEPTSLLLCCGLAAALAAVRRRR